MKLLTSLTLLILFVVPAATFAQQTETLFSANVDHGGFGSLLFGVTSVNGEASYLRGTSGAWVLNFQDGHSVNVGIGWYRTESAFSAVRWTHPDIDIPEIKTNYSGFELEYLNRSHRLLHFGGQLMIGGGSVRYHNEDINLDKTSDRYFALQPGANIHLNITNWFRVSGGLFYRYATGVNLDGTNNSELSGFSGILGLRFGKF